MKIKYFRRKNKEWLITLKDFDKFNYIIRDSQYLHLEDFFVSRVLAEVHFRQKKKSQENLKRLTWLNLRWLRGPDLNW